MVMWQSYISYLWLLGDGRWSSWCCSSCCSCPVNSCSSSRVSAPCSQSISPDTSQETCHDMQLWPICCHCYIWVNAFLFFFFTFTAAFISIIIFPSCCWCLFSCCCSTLFVDLYPWCHVVDASNVVWVWQNDFFVFAAFALSTCQSYIVDQVCSMWQCWSMRDFLLLNFL